MFNEQNLIRNEDRTPEERREFARKAGLASGKARKEKRAVQKILSDFLSMQADDVPQLRKMAEKLGISGTGSVKELFTIICAVNTMYHGNLGDLEKLVGLLGEKIDGSGSEAKQQAAFLDAVKKAVSDED